MTFASGTWPGSAESTPLTSVQMTISRAPSSAPKMEAEKSLPFRPSVVCRPRVSLATKPGITSTPASSGATRRDAFSREALHCTPGPSGPHSTATTSRASSQRTARPGSRARR